MTTAKESLAINISFTIYPITPERFNSLLSLIHFLSAKGLPRIATILPDPSLITEPAKPAEMIFISSQGLLLNSKKVTIIR
jgi:hypothetical protein